MNKGRTVSELRWPDTPDFVDEIKKWQADAIKRLVEIIWAAYDNYYREVLSVIDISEADEELERSITQDLALKMDDILTGFEPFCVQHERYEVETRRDPPARSPQCDIAFVLRNNPRIMWPLEAKVLRSERTVAEYVKEIQDNYLTCRKSPFSSQAGMLGYLLSGDPEIAFQNISTRLGCTLAKHPDLMRRNHRVSDHQRAIPTGKSYPHSFQCHHLMLELIPKPRKAQ